MKSTREKILQALLGQPKMTINALAEAVGINPISVRHHLNNLQVEGLVASEEERHGVGRPHLVYRLTEEGLEKFPTRYLRLTSRLLQRMKDTMPEPVVQRLFSEIGEGMADEHAGKLEGLTIEERLDLVKSVLGEEGFRVEWEKAGAEYKIHEISCPYLQIGAHHPEVCAVDQTIISRMLAVPAERVQCILEGSAHCTYVVQTAER